LLISLYYAPSVAAVRRHALSAFCVDAERHQELFRIHERDAPPSTKYTAYENTRRAKSNVAMAETVRKRLRMTVKTVKTNKSKRDVWRKPRPLSVLRWVSISDYVDLMLKQLYRQTQVTRTMTCWQTCC
jgi:hypothetical protein